MKTVAGRPLLVTVAPNGASAMEGPDWISPSRAATIDRVELSR